MDFRPSEETHPGTPSAVEAVRAAVETVSVRYLVPGAVTLDADDEWGGASFRFPHAGEPGTEVCLSQGDGYFRLDSPLGTYGGYLTDEELREFVAALLVGSLWRTDRWLGAALVTTRWYWVDRAGATHVLRPPTIWRTLWRRALPLPERVARRSISFDRVPAVMTDPAGAARQWREKPADSTR